MKKNYYQILGLEKNASQEQIKKAYRLYASKFHPDKHKNDKFFENQFKLIKEAYDVLSDPKSRRNYDHIYENEPKRYRQNSYESSDINNTRKSHKSTNKSSKENESEESRTESRSDNFNKSRSQPIYDDSTLSDYDKFSLKAIGFYFAILLAVIIMGRSCVSNGTNDYQNSVINSPHTDEKTLNSTETPLYSAEDLGNASLEGNLEMVQQIVEAGVDVDEGIQRDWTALMYASNRGRIEVVQYLVEKGANVGKQTSEGLTPLMFAANSTISSPETVKLLLERGADPNKTSEEGHSALMYAAVEGYVEVIELLLEYNADTSFEDNDGMTAADYAIKYGHFEIAKLLSKNKE